MHYRSLGKRVGNVVRLAEVVQVLVRHGFADLVRRAGLHEGIPAKLLRGLRLIEAPSGEPETFGRRLRAALTELGPTFVKCGQILSTRPDLISPDLCAELERLQDRVTTLPFEKMSMVLEEDIQGTVEELFGSFDTEPVAAASLSQVYRATLKTGQVVGVKIQRPNIDKVIEADLRLMRGVAEWIVEHVEDLDWFNPLGIVDEFARSIRRELDFTVEAHSIERFRENFKESKEVFVPATYSDLSGRRVLTMDWVEGVRIDALDQYAERNCDPKTVASTGCHVLCRQVFEHRLFHADPHPGNVLIMRDNQIAFLDYGMVGHIEQPDVAAIADLLRAMFREDAAACVDAILALSLSEDFTDRTALEYEMAEFLAFEGYAIISSGQVGRGIERATDVLRRHHLELAPRFSLLLKALVTIESVGHVLDPNLDMVPIIRPYVERIVARRYSPWAILGDLYSDIAGLARLGRQLPADIQQLMRTFRRGQFKVQLHHEGLHKLSAVLDRASNRIAFGVITGSIIIGSSMLMTTDIGLHGLGLAGYLAAGLLGLSLVISIIRSRNL
jgi:ubiquinone biosynthesis protein